MQYVSNKEAYAVVCRIYYRLKHPREKANINLTRIGLIEFNLTRQETLNIQSNARLIEERLNMRECGGGFIRTGRGPKERSAKDGKII